MGTMLIVGLLCIVQLFESVYSSTTLQQIFSRLDSEALNDSELIALAAIFDKTFTAVTTSKHEAILSSHSLDDLYFHSNGCTVRTTNGQLYYDGKGKRTHTDLRRRTVVVTVEPAYLFVETNFRINRLSYGDVISRAKGSTRTTYKELKCEGLAALDFEPRLSIEWVQLFCDHVGAQIKTEVELDGPIFGKEVESFIEDGFGEVLQEKLERDVTTGLENIFSSWLTTRLDNVSSSVRIQSVIKNEAYKEAAKQEVIEANDVLDGILAFAAALIKENYNDSIRIPDIREGFEKNNFTVEFWRNFPLVEHLTPVAILIEIFSIVRVGAQFIATDGKAYGVSSIERVGSARLQRTGPNVYFSSTFRFKDLFLKYDQYRAEVIGLGPTGTVSTSLAPVSARVMVHVDFNERKAYLDKLRIAELGKVDVRITGLGSVLNFLVSRIVSWVIATFKNQVLSLVEARVKRNIQESLGKSSLDDIISGRAFSKK